MNLKSECTLDRSPFILFVTESGLTSSICFPNMDYNITTLEELNNAKPSIPCSSLDIH